MSEVQIESGLKIDNSYAEQLTGFYVEGAGDKAPNPQLVKFNSSLAKQLGFDLDNLSEPDLAAMLSGGTTPVDACPLSQVYAGHQFGGFSPQLGDGRALLLAEVIDTQGQRLDIHLKGSGLTPFSRGGDGKAVLGPVLREYILAEAMHALDIPTTRALAAVTTGEQIMRSGLLPGAVIARVASSHIRVGTFQFFSARGEQEQVKKLADYTIARHYPQLKGTSDCYLGLLRAVLEAQVTLIAKWMAVGFVHGVMNTDNMTICGETIDYGPCAFIDNYHPEALFSSIDQQGRYAFGNQPGIAQWDLARFAECLLPLIDDDIDEAVKQASEVINGFSDCYQQQWLASMRGKLGLTRSQESDLTLVNDLLDMMAQQQVDFTQLFRALARVVVGDNDAAVKLFSDTESFMQWQVLWLARLTQQAESNDVIAAAMNALNPIYIPRNHQVEKALQAAENNGDFAPFEQLMTVLAQPFTPRQGLEEYELAAPAEFGRYRTFCGT